jgi:AbiU2
MPNLPQSLRDDFEALNKEVSWFHFDYQTLKYLYLNATKNEYEAYDRVAPYFFDRHHNILLERIYLGLRQFTDVATKGRNHNLSFRYFLEELRTLRDVSDLESEIASFEDGIAPIKSTLHKKIAHLDRSMRIGTEKPTWLQRPEFESACSLVFDITNSIALLGWKFEVGFLDPLQGGDLNRLIKQLIIKT